MCGYTALTRSGRQIRPVPTTATRHCITTPSGSPQQPTSLLARFVVLFVVSVVDVYGQLQVPKSNCKEGKSYISQYYGHISV